MVTYFPDIGTTYVYFRISVTITGLIILTSLKYSSGIFVTVTD